MFGALETPFHGQKLSVLIGGSLSWSETLIFIRGHPYECCQSCLWAPKCKKKNFFSNSYISGTKWPRHQRWVLNWRFLQKLECEPIFEQVTLSWSSGEKEKAWGRSAPPRCYKVQKVPGFIGLKGFYKFAISMEPNTCVHYCDYFPKFNCVRDTEHQEYVCVCVCLPCPLP